MPVEIAKVRDDDLPSPARLRFSLVARGSQCQLRQIDDVCKCLKGLEPATRLERVTC